MKEKKTCTRCGKIKEMSEFSKNRNTSDGYCHWCKSCYKDYNSEKKGKGRVMQKEIIQLTHFWADKLGVRITEIKFRHYSRSLARAFSINWTSDLTGRITYHKHINKILTRTQKSCLALHEVVHLVVRGYHNKKWKAMMAKYMPDWKQIDKEIDDSVWKDKYHNKGVK